MINVLDAMVRVRERVHDREGRTFDDAEVMRACDDALRQLSTAIRTVSAGANLDSVDVPLTDFATLEPTVRQWEVPEYIQDIQMVEALQSNGSTRQLPQTGLEQKDVGRGTFAGHGLVWLFGPRGTIQVRGTVDSFQGARVWFVRQMPPLIYLTASVGSTATSTTPSATTGAFKARDNLYVSFQFEGTTGAIAGQVRRCTGFAGGVFTFPAWSASTASQAMAMVIPLDDEYLEYFCALVSLKLFRRQGAEEEMQLLIGEVQQLQAQFEAGLARRSSGEPPRLFSSRRIW